MALCTTRVSAAVARGAARHYSALTVPLDESLPGVSCGMALPEGVEKKPTAKVSTLKNGLKVASIETFSPVASVGLVVGAGSAYEAANEIGASALFRQMAFKSTNSSTQFAVARTTELLGGRLHASSTRDHLILVGSATRDSLAHIVDVLGGEFTQKAIHPWEVSQACNEIAYQAYPAVHDGSFQVLDLLHSAAFRGPLSSSVNAPAHRLAKVTPETLTQWAASKYTTGNAVLVGYGVQHGDLVALAEASFGGAASGGAAARAKSKYAGASEARLDTASPVTYAAIGFEGAAAGTSEALALGVAQYALGVGSSIKWGSSAAPLSAKLAAVMKAPATLSAFSASYADAGLFGVVAAANGSDIGCAVGAAKDALTEAAKGLSKADVARGKAQLKLAVHMAAECVDHAIEDLGAQVLATGKYQSAAEAAKAIDALSDSQVSDALKKALRSKPSLAVVGDLAQGPRLDDLA